MYFFCLLGALIAYSRLENDWKVFSIVFLLFIITVGAVKVSEAIVDLVTKIYNDILK